MHYLAIFIGGGAGSLLRFIITKFVQNTPMGIYPLGTLLSNILASFILGYLTIAVTQDWADSTRLGWMVGFCGGFSTFSTFTSENFQLIQSGNWILFFLNVLISVAVCLLFFILGYRLGG